MKGCFLDDVEAVVHGVSFALDYRMEFGEDVFIDLGKRFNIERFKISSS